MAFEFNYAILIVESILEILPHDYVVISIFARIDCPDINIARLKADFLPDHTTKFQGEFRKESEFLVQYLLRRLRDTVRSRNFCGRCDALGASRCFILTLHVFVGV